MTPSAVAAPNAPSRPPQAAEADDEINISEYVDILLDRKWLVASVTALAVALGMAYALFSTPIYQSNLLVQVEDSAPDAKGFLGDSASLFEVKTPASGEIQIIRSRSVLGAAVDQTKLYIEAMPRYLPVVGTWMARRANGLSTPGFLGMQGYVTGKEKIEVAQFDVPLAFEDGAPFIVTALGEGRYTLSHPNLNESLTGTVGKPLVNNSNGGPLNLLIDTLAGNPGAQFTVSRDSRLGTIEDLQKRLQLAEQGKPSNVISVTLDDSDRQRLANILNAIGTQYVKQNVERKAAEAQKTLDFLDVQLPQFKKQLEASEDAYTKFRNANKTVALDEEAKVVLGQSVELQTKLLEAQQHRRELAAKYTDTNPRVRMIDSQIAAVQRELGGLSNRVAAMPTTQQDALRLERDVRVNGELYKSLLNSALQLRLVKEGKIGNVRLLDSAVQPKRPIKPQKSMIVALALVLGLVAGVALAIARSLFMGGVRNPQEIEAHTGLNVYSVVPFTSEQIQIEQRATAKTPGVQLLAVSHPESPAIEALRSLRIALQFTTLEAGNNRVLITGATPATK
ncbi:MAG: tyrosine protein kinase, partial [Comamonadaceae bacterium]